MLDSVLGCVARKPHLYLCGGILLLAFWILVVRYASYRYPSTKVLDADGKEVEDGK
ncbi:hypothetical protein SAMN05216185_11651 [Pseudomonas guariconensis]|nr:hypothetical protein SAMN05216185_11651 [Pseudomonas guariconensis]